MKTSALLFASSFASTILAAPPSEQDPVPDDQKCGLEYESVAGARRAEQNYHGCNERPGYNELFAPYDAYYNGELKVEWSGEPPCKTNTVGGNGTLRLGQIQHPVDTNISRAAFDNNPFYFSFSSSNSSQCSSAVTTCPPWIDATSSSSTYWWSQFWTLSSTKIDNGYAISGNLSTTKTNGAFNGYYVKTLDCKDAGSYDNDIVTAKDEISMTGTVTPDKVELSFTVSKLFTDYSFAGGHPLSVNPTFKFTGTPLKGAKLSTNGTNIATAGSSIEDNAVKNAALKSKAKTIIYAVAGGVAGLVALVIILCCVCCIRRRNKKEVYQQQAYVQHQPAPQYVQQAAYEPYRQQ